MKRRQFIRVEGETFYYNRKWMRDHPTARKAFVSMIKEKAINGVAFFSTKKTSLAVK